MCLVFNILLVFLGWPAAAMRGETNIQISDERPRPWELPLKYETGPQVVVKEPTGDCPCATCSTPNWINVVESYDFDGFFTTRDACHYTLKKPKTQWWCEVNSTCTCAAEEPGGLRTWRWAPCGHGSVQMTHFMEQFPKLEWAIREELCAQWEDFKNETRPLVWEPIKETMDPLCNRVQYEKASTKVQDSFPHLAADLQVERELVTLIHSKLQNEMDPTGRPEFVDAMDVCYQSLENKGRKLFRKGDPCLRMDPMNTDLSKWEGTLADKLGNSDVSKELGQLCQSRSMSLKALKTMLKEYRRSKQIDDQTSARTEQISSQRQKMNDRWAQLEKDLVHAGKIKNVAELTPRQPVIAPLKSLTNDRLNQLALLMRKATKAKCSSKPQKWNLRCCREALLVDGDSYYKILQKLREKGY